MYQITLKDSSYSNKPPQSKVSNQLTFVLLIHLHRPETFTNLEDSIWIVTSKNGKITDRIQAKAALKHRSQNIYHCGEDYFSIKQEFIFACSSSVEKSTVNNKGINFFP